MTRKISEKIGVDSDSPFKLELSPFAATFTDDNPRLRFNAPKTSEYDMDFFDFLKNIQSPRKQYFGPDYLRKARILLEAAPRLKERYPQAGDKIDAALEEGFQADDSYWYENFWETSGAVTKVLSADFDTVHEIISAAAKKYPRPDGLSFTQLGLATFLGGKSLPAYYSPDVPKENETPPANCPPWPQKTYLSISPRGVRFAKQDLDPPAGWYKKEMETIKGPMKVCVKVDYSPNSFGITGDPQKIISGTSHLPPSARDLEEALFSVEMDQDRIKGKLNALKEKQLKVQERKDRLERNGYKPFTPENFQMGHLLIWVMDHLRSLGDRASLEKAVREAYQAKDLGEAIRIFIKKSGVDASEVQKKISEYFEDYPQGVSYDLPPPNPPLIALDDKLMSATVRHDMTNGEIENLSSDITSAIKRIDDRMDQIEERIRLLEKMEWFFTKN